MCHRRNKIVLLQTCMYDCSTSELSCPKEVSITLGNYFGLFGKIWLCIIIGTFCRNLLAIANTYITLHYVPFRIMYISSKNRQCYGCKIVIEYSTSKTNSTLCNIFKCGVILSLNLTMIRLSNKQNKHGYCLIL